MKFGRVVGAVCVMLSVFALGEGSRAQGNGALTVALNKTAFKAGEIMRVNATLTPITPARPVDAYIVVQLPNGSMLSLQLGGALVPGLVPIARGIVPFQFTGQVAQYVFTGAEPTGSYTWLHALTESGTLNVLGTVGRSSFTIGDSSTTAPVAVLIPNADTNAMAVVSLPDGSSTTYFGPKNASGIPLRISETVTLTTDHLRADQTFNELGAPVAVKGSDGSRVTYGYPAPNLVTLTISPPSGSSIVVSYNPQTGEILSDQRASTVTPVPGPVPEYASIITSMDVEGYVITKCGETRASADDVSVQFDIDPTYVELRTGTYTQVKFDLPAPELTTGLYGYAVPTQPLPLGPTVLNQVAAETNRHLNMLCNALKANGGAAFPLGNIELLKRHLEQFAQGPPPYSYPAKLALAALTAFQAACLAAGSEPFVDPWLDRALDLITARGFINVRARSGTNVINRSERFDGSSAGPAPEFNIALDPSRCVEPQVEGQNRIVLAGSWRIVFVSQEDNYALRVRTVDGEKPYFIDEDNALLPPIEIRDTEPPSGWTVDVSDWGDDPGQAYVERTKVDNDTYLFRIEVTHGSPTSPYDDAVLRFERILPPTR